MKQNKLPFSFTLIIIFLAFVMIFLLFSVYSIVVKNENNNIAIIEAQSEDKLMKHQSSKVSFSNNLYKVDNFEISINNYEYIDKIVDNSGKKIIPSDNCKFCVLNITVKNTGNLSHVFETTNYFSYRYKYLPKSFFNLQTSFPSILTLDPLFSKTGDMYFEIPNEIIYDDTVPYIVFKTESGDLRIQIPIV